MKKLTCKIRETDTCLEVLTSILKECQAQYSLAINSEPWLKHAFVYASEDSQNRETIKTALCAMVLYANNRFDKDDLNSIKKKFSDLPLSL